MSIGSFFGNIGGTIRLGWKTYGPTIMVGVGITGFIATSVLAAKETPKALEIIEETDEEVKDLKHDVEELSKDGEDHTEEIDWYHKEITHAYFRCAGGVAKAYLPAVLTGIFSCGCVLGGYGTMFRRCSGLAAAFNSLYDNFNDYRGRVRGELGDEREDMLYRGYEEREVDVVDTDSGEISKRKCLGPSANNRRGRYSFIFNDRTSSEWEPNKEMLRAYLEQKEQYWNHVLQGNIGYKYHRHVFLFDVLEDLGMLVENDINKITKEDILSFRIIGWMLEKRIDPVTKEIKYVTGNDNSGDGYISFGIREDPYDPFTYYLDFNVDGVILHDITNWLG